MPQVPSENSAHILLFDPSRQPRRVAEKPKRAPKQEPDAHLPETSTKLWERFQSVRERARKSGDQRTVFECVEMFKKWAEKAYDVGGDIRLIDEVFYDVCTMVLPFANRGPVGLAHFIRHLTTAALATRRTRELVKPQDLSILTQTAEREGKLGTPEEAREVEALIRVVRGRIDQGRVREDLEALTV